MITKATPTSSDGLSESHIVPVTSFSLDHVIAPFVETIRIQHK